MYLVLPHSHTQFNRHTKSLQTEPYKLKRFYYEVDTVSHRAFHPITVTHKYRGLFVITTALWESEPGVLGRTCCTHSELSVAFASFINFLSFFFLNLVSRREIVRCVGFACANVQRPDNARWTLTNRASDGLLYDAMAINLLDWSSWLLLKLILSITSFQSFGIWSLTPIGKLSKAFLVGNLQPLNSV